MMPTLFSRIVFAVGYNSKNQLLHCPLVDLSFGFGEWIRRFGKLDLPCRSVSQSTSPQLYSPTDQAVNQPAHSCTPLPIRQPINQPTVTLPCRSGSQSTSPQLHSPADQAVNQPAHSCTPCRSGSRSTSPQLHSPVDQAANQPAHSCTPLPIRQSVNQPTAALACRSGSQSTRVVGCDQNWLKKCSNIHEYKIINNDFINL